MARNYNNNYGNRNYNRNNYRNRNYNNGNRNYNNRGSNFTDLERTAFKMGMIVGSLDSSDNRITDSFVAGQEALTKARKGKKPLF